MLPHLISVHYCYNYLINQTPVSLLLYSHIPTALTALFFGLFVFIKTRSRTSFVLLIICLSFTAWCLSDLGSWFDFSSAITMFTWSLLDFISLIIFFFSYYFLYIFITKRDLPIWQWIIGLVLMLPTVIWTLFGSNLLYFDSNNCVAVENTKITGYLFFALAIFIIVSVVFSIIQYKKNKNDVIVRKEILLVSSGTILFLVFFYSALLLVSILAESSISSYVYNYEIYGLFGMPILLVFLCYLVVKFKAFDIKLIMSQALVWALIILIGSQFAFIQNNTNKILTAITLVLSSVTGYIIVQSVKKEVALREQLEIVTIGQKNLIHLMNHQIKGYLSVSKDIFAELLTDDYGKVPEEAKYIITKGLESSDNGQKYVTDILKGASAENGTLPYDMISMDFKETVLNVIENQKEKIEKKNLKLSVDISDGNYHMIGDKAQLGEVVRNLIENSIYYTPIGGIFIHLKRKADNIIFSVKDTGVGVKEEDKSKLFKAGGVGNESRKINVSSSGYGLAFVKGVVEKHKGKVWFESAGADKGSTFYIELPIVSK